MVGDGSWLEGCVARHAWASGGPDMSRTPTTPFARKRRWLQGARASDAPWTCISHKPGMRNLPVPSMTAALLGICVFLHGPTATMRSPSDPHTVRIRQLPRPSGARSATGAQVDYYSAFFTGNAAKARQTAAALIKAAEYLGAFFPQLDKANSL